MDPFELIRTQMAQALPFVRYLGIEIAEVGAGRGVTKVAERDELRNHLGTQHAGVIFTLAEAASGAAMSGTFADVILAIRPLAAEASVRHLKLAKGPLTAIATVAEPAADIRTRFEAEGRAAFAVTVEVNNDQGQRVAEMSVAWDVRRT